MDYINTFKINGVDYRLKNNNRMTKVYTHMFKADEVLRYYDDEKNEVDLDSSSSSDQQSSVLGSCRLGYMKIGTGYVLSEKPHFIASETNNDKLYFNYLGTSYDFRLTDNYEPSQENPKKNCYYDGHNIVTTTENRSKMYSVFDGVKISSEFSDYENPVSFSNLNITNGKVRVSYSGGKGYTKKGFNIVLGIEDYSYKSIILPVPEIVLPDDYIYSINFSFEFDKDRQNWHIECEREFSRSFSGTAFKNISKTFNYCISGLSTQGWVGSTCSKIQNIIIPNNNLPSIGTIIEFWADTDEK